MLKLSGRSSSNKLKRSVQSLTAFCQLLICESPIKSHADWCSLYSKTVEKPSQLFSSFTHHETPAEKPLKGAPHPSNTWHVRSIEIPSSKSQESRVKSVPRFKVPFLKEYQGTFVCSSPTFGLNPKMTRIWSGHPEVHFTEQWMSRFWLEKRT